MTHQQHVNLIKKGVTKQGGVWADFGSGGGAFTLALRDLAGEDVAIYSLDKDSSRLHNQKENFDRQFPKTDIQYMHQDFTQELDLPKLDGILMANSLHYVQEQVQFLQQIKKYLKKDGKLLIVEYSTDAPNYWLPYPLSFTTFVHLTEEAGFHQPTQVGKVASSWLDEMYAAEAKK